MALKDFRFPDIWTILIGVILTLVMVQVFSILLTQIFGIQQLKLGTGFLILMTGLAFVLIARTTQMYGSYQFSRSMLLVTVIIIAGVVAAYIYLPQIVPDIFSVAVDNLRWFVQ